MLRKILKYDLAIKIAAGFVAILMLVLWKGLPQEMDNSMQRLFYAVSGEVAPDSNIVLIRITKDDIEALGGWPLKRSYYALLINTLQRYNVKKTGIEVFFGGSNPSQAVYDGLLAKEAEKAGNVVFAALANDAMPSGKAYTAASVTYPAFFAKGMSSGHLSYFEATGVIVPLHIRAGGEAISSFAAAMLEKQMKMPDRAEIQINFISSWTKFRGYGLREFFDMAGNNDPRLNALAGKYVLAGVTDPKYAARLDSPFDDAMPGIALHAFAIDNLLHRQYIRDEYYTVSGGVFILIFFFMLLFASYYKIRRSISFYLIMLAAFFFVDFAIYFIYYLELNYSALLLPLLLVLAIELVTRFVTQGISIERMSSEAALLRNLLGKRSDELKRIERELQDGDDAAGTLAEKARFLKEEVRRLRSKEDNNTAIPPEEITAETTEYMGIVYASKAMGQTVDLMRQVAPFNETVLISGESGTGKELFAKAIHQLSIRCVNPFVAVNCGAISENLLESELFGHVKGAFTGAYTDKPGRFEAANGGTLFLDEIGEISESFQVKLLRVLQDGTYQRVGSNETRYADVRVIAATNKDLEKLAAEGKFRQDLFYRLNVLRISIPPLRERKEDIPVIAHHFMQQHSSTARLSLAALDALINYAWRGNVRELESIIKRSVVFAKALNKDFIQVTDLPQELTRGLDFSYEDIVLEALRRRQFSHNSFTETAKELSVSRTLVSEHFRGFAFRVLTECDFDIPATVRNIAGTEDPAVLEKVKAKLGVFLKNIREDVLAAGNSDLHFLKDRLAVKYKNLPKKFHYYLDEVIRHSVTGEFLKDFS